MALAFLVPHPFRCNACASCWSRTRVQGVQQRTGCPDDSRTTPPVAWLTARILSLTAVCEHEPHMQVPHRLQWCLRNTRLNGRAHTMQSEATASGTQSWLLCTNCLCQSLSSGSSSGAIVPPLPPPALRGALGPAAAAPPAALEGYPGFKRTPTRRDSSTPADIRTVSGVRQRWSREQGVARHSGCRFMPHPAHLSPCCMMPIRSCEHASQKVGT